MMMPPYSQVKLVHDQMVRDAIDHQGQGLLQTLGKALAHRFGAKYAETVTGGAEIEATPDTALQTFKTLVPYTPALEERETACA